jgi:hypothetical protein
VLFSPDGRLALTIGLDHSAQLWNVPTVVKGSPEKIIRLVEMMTRKKLDPTGAIRALDIQSWSYRLRRVDPSIVSRGFGGALGGAGGGFNMLGD